MKRREVIDLLHEILTACKGRLSPDAIYITSDNIEEYPFTTISDEDLCVKLKVSDDYFFVLNGIIEKKGLRMEEINGFIKIFKPKDSLNTPLLC